MGHPLKIGLQIPSFTWPGGPDRIGADLAAIARTADQAGFDSIAVMDHLFQIRAFGPPQRVLVLVHDGHVPALLMELERDRRADTTAADDKCVEHGMRVAL